MKRLNAALRFTCLLAATFTTVFLSQAGWGDRHISIAHQKQTCAHAIHIVDQNGRPAVSGVRSATGQIFDVAVAPSGMLLFEPTWFSISVGDTVRWTWDDDGHSVTSGENGTADGQFVPLTI